MKNVVNVLKTVTPLDLLQDTVSVLVIVAMTFYVASLGV